MPVELVDERYTTAAALRAIREMGGSTRGRKGDVDALAATVLLQHALATRELTRRAAHVPRALSRSRVADRRELAACGGTRKPVRVTIPPGAIVSAWPPTRWRAPA